MSDTVQNAAFLAIVLENVELREQLSNVQDQCVELAVDAGEQHAEVEALRAQVIALGEDRDRWRIIAERRLAG
ncbi:hypothetical protein G3T14_23980 [Methylobacterium sp. BTF04]|uniref:hypothetical protein n=1 Tax=Methylobacterium sp. BTF04 TaxID=2708300 RepID=UPI0013D57655|nr:hypothetical protein [Methylobacterium sp. BTF04]NEU15090.1 hypothetical protein [Methylobacterium sp. BTF04]